MEICTVPNCGREATATGRCAPHYQRARLYGPDDPRSLYLVGQRPRPTAEERFWAKVDRRGDSECWPWTGALQPNGYGRFTSDNRRASRQGSMAYRYAYELLVGPIPDGLVIDHMCHTPECKLGNDCPHRRCVNPAHLEPKTQAENQHRSTVAEVQRARHARRTHCKDGHELTPANTYVVQGRRRCRECLRIKARARGYDRATYLRWKAKRGGAGGRRKVG